MKDNVRNSTCKRRGCIITLLPSDSRIRLIDSRMYGAKYDTKKVLFMAYLSLDEELAQEGQMEKKAA